MSDTPADQAEDVISRLIQTRLRELFEARDEGRPPYTEAEVARELTARGHRITAEGIRNLLKSPRINPKATTLRALAEFFNVPAGYLLGDEEPQTASREARVMARSIEKLTPRSRKSLARVIDEFLHLEQAAREIKTEPATSDE
ncbi:hypothetical protein [Micromonospora aurantiaca (nom. illeg.)]|uniref:hypothetical protein n=1 Tax=Micromonospora aurantiaca (nom. illeg.) TaxID=47850 RepID=UPI0037A0C13D